MSHSLIATAKAWADADPDIDTQAEVRVLLDTKDEAALEERFGASLEFGTAGLRGVLGGGTNRMNRAVVRRTTLGLGRYLLQHTADARLRGVVIGYDARRLSREFAEDAAAVLGALGIVAHFFEDVAPTPLVAFAVNHLSASAGIVVTASHNPPEYNGYKVYWGNGAQIIPPHDKGIASEIEKTGPANAIALLPEASARAQGLLHSVSPSVCRAYFDALLQLRPTRQLGDIRIVYTAMHGVGGAFVAQLFEEAGFTKTEVVVQQQVPDGSFPTVRFPNPEEKGAMDLATALAEAKQADLVLANDPDADRLAVMARGIDGRLRLLSGNEVGVLLGHFTLTQMGSQRPLVATTIVSSAQLFDLAKALGARCVETLTGFKWIANRAMELEKTDNVNFVFGYEEALGYTVGTVVRDKDGIGAALVVADMAAWCQAQGKTLLGYLEDIQRAHGLYVGRQFNATLPGASGAKKIAKVMEAFRHAAPQRIGDWRVDSVSDYQRRVRRFLSHEERLELPSSNVIAFGLEGGGRVTLRPSGTEPKIKFYFELKETCGATEAMAAARARAEVKLEALEKAFVALARAQGL
jgi:phosphomannomutase